MVSNNAARRLLGMPYKLSRSKKNLRVSIVTKDNATSKLPDDLKNKSVVAALKNRATEKKTYHSTTVFYPEYVIS